MVDGCKMRGVRGRVERNRPNRAVNLAVISQTQSVGRGKNQQFIVE